MMGRVSGASLMIEVMPAGQITAHEALREALINLKSVCTHMKKTFQEAVEIKREEIQSEMETS